MRRIPDASAKSLMPFVEEAIEPGSVVHTDDWLGYVPLEGKATATGSPSCGAKSNPRRN
jgi:hypothetical protein